MSYKWWILVAVFLFGGGLALGLVIPTGVAVLRAEDVAALQEMANLLASLPQLSVFALILIKNVSAVLISFIFSPLFCLVPIIALTFNGLLLGLVSAAVIQEESLGFLLAGLLPHGILEIPAFIIGEAVALSFGAAVVLAAFKKERRSLLLPHLRRDLRYLLVALALLLPAALIETYLTPLLIR